jgi:hypothetical protein
MPFNPGLLLDKQEQDSTRTKPTPRPRTRRRQKTEAKTEAKAKAKAKAKDQGPRTKDQGPTKRIKGQEYQGPTVRTKDQEYQGPRVPRTKSTKRMGPGAPPQSSSVCALEPRPRQTPTPHTKGQDRGHQMYKPNVPHPSLPSIVRAVSVSSVLSFVLSSQSFF